MIKDNNPVFIVGLPRTGTSLMYRTVQKSPDFRIKKLNLSETRIFRPKTSFITPDFHYPGLLNYIFNDKEIYSSFLQSIKKYTNKLQRRNKTDDYNIIIKREEHTKEKWKILAANKLTELKWKRSLKKKIIKEYFKFAQKCRQSKRIVEKTPHHYLNVHQIVWTFPDSRIIWMIRHPIDIITSSIKRSAIDKNYANYWNVDDFIKEFRGSFHRYNFYKQLFKDNLLLIKYEDFVNNPAGEFKKICDFIDETFTRDALIVKEQEVLPWKSPDLHIFSDIVKKTGKNWKDHLSLEDAGKIETALQDLMKKYNFNFYSEGG